MSQLVQKGLALLAPEAEKLDRPEWAKARIAAAANRFRAAARQDYEDGYRAGIELAEQAPWDWVLWLERRQFNISYLLSVHSRVEHRPEDGGAEVEYMTACRSGSWPSEWHLALFQVFRAELAPPGEEDCPYRSDQFLAGFGQAFRDVWDAVNMSVD
ncbi:hypothetical protein ACIQI7_09080 [Kitasatospora sp. NPDC092039]|uniref:hypothetical protein n=1 Tax=Kitasatospora sp. NPDC092039 TaxID=3364086 RepID=UPI00382A7F08